MRLKIKRKRLKKHKKRLLKIETALLRKSRKLKKLRIKSRISTMKKRG